MTWTHLLTPGQDHCRIFNQESYTPKYGDVVSSEARRIYALAGLEECPFQDLVLTGSRLTSAIHLDWFLFFLVFTSSPPQSLYYHHELPPDQKRDIRSSVVMSKKDMRRLDLGAHILHTCLSAARLDPQSNPFPRPQWCRMSNPKRMKSHPTLGVSRDDHVYLDRR